jgi:hypothetical protein
MQQTPNRYSVHAADEGRGREHLVEGASFEDAAVAFVETWHPEGDEQDEVAVIVRDCESGRETCIRVDLGSGATEPCG